MMEDILLIHLKRVVKVKKGQNITLRDIANVQARTSEVAKYEEVILYKTREASSTSEVIDRFLITNKLKVKFPHLHMQFFGPNETLLKKEGKKRLTKVLFIFAWLVLFLGTTMTMMNFHFDVNMQEVHVRIHYLLTGEQVKQPLFIQIPYALGIAVGMLLFLNESFLHKHKKGPTPLELEMYHYEKNVASYLADERQNKQKENK